MNSGWGLVAFWVVGIIIIAGSSIGLFFSLGAAAADSLSGGDAAPESARERIGRVAFTSLDVLLAMASVVLLLVLSLVLMIGLILGSVRPLVVIWAPLLGTALSGGAFVSAATAHIKRRRHRWAVQLAALVLPVLAYLVARLVDRLMP